MKWKEIQKYWALQIKLLEDKRAADLAPKSGLTFSEAWRQAANGQRISRLSRPEYAVDVHHGERSGVNRLSDADICADDWMLLGPTKTTKTATGVVQDDYQINYDGGKGTPAPPVGAKVWVEWRE